MTFIGFAISTIIHSIEVAHFHSLPKIYQLLYAAM